MNTKAAIPLRQGERFGPLEHIKKRRDFLMIQRRGQRRRGRCLLWTSRKGAQPWTRIGLTVSRKVGNAVVRNRVKRHLREIFRRDRAAFPKGRDIVIIAMASAATASFQALREDLLRLC